MADLEAFSSAVECSYGVLFGLHLLNRPEYDVNDVRYDFMAQSHVALMSILTSGWRATPRIQNMAGRLSATFDYIGQRRALLRTIRREAYTWLDGSALAVQSINMNSPGSISLAGLGEPIRQLRHLIKDVWYRNRQEKERGQLEIELMRRRLAQLDIPQSVRDSATLDGATMLLTHATRDLAEMEERGLLLDVPENIDPQHDDAA